MKYRKRDRGWPGMTAVALALLLMVGLFLTGCGNNPNNASPGNQKAGAPGKELAGAER
jgi:hypothetical protein